MLMLYQRQRAPSPSVSTATRAATTTAISTNDNERVTSVLANPAIPHAASFDASTPSNSSSSYLALMSPLPSSSRRTRRYRSRNCDNFRRFGELFQFVDVETNDADTTDNTVNNLPLRARRRSVRAHDRRMTAALRDVQQRVVELEQQRDLLHSAKLNAHASAVTNALDIVQQFYELFANGYNPTAAPVPSQRAAAFLHAVMDRDVVCTEFRGVDLFLHQYEASSLAHASFALMLQNVSVLTSESDGHAIQVKAQAICTLRIKRATLEQLFPSIICDEVLTQQLIGHEYSLQYDKVFHFHASQVFQHETRIDFCNGLLNMVQDPFVAMKLLDASLMTRDGHWRIDHRIEEGAHTLENSVL